MVEMSSTAETEKIMSDQIMVKAVTQESAVVPGAIVKLIYPGYMNRADQFLKIERVKHSKLSGKQLEEIEDELDMAFPRDVLLAWGTPVDEPSESWRCPLVKEFT